MNKKVQKLKQDIENLESKRSLLIQSIGLQRFNEMVGAIENIVNKNNLNKTPTIVKDLFDYISMSICISKDL